MVHGQHILFYLLELLLIIRNEYIMSNKIDTWLKENHKDIYDEYLSSLNTKRERESYSEQFHLMNLQIIL